MELSSSNINFFYIYIFSYISENGKPGKKFLIFQGKKTLKQLLIFQKMELFSLSREKFLIFQETENQKKLPIFSQKKVLFTFRETKTPKKFIIFQEKELYYISGKGTFLYFGKGIFRTLAYLELETYLEPWYI